MPRFAITAIVSCSRIVASQIPRRLAQELKKPRYKHFVDIEGIDYAELKE